jgi:hypothetical protein
MRFLLETGSRCGDIAGCSRPLGWSAFFVITMREQDDPYPDTASAICSELDCTSGADVHDASLSYGVRFASSSLAKPAQAERRWRIVTGDRGQISSS